MPILEGDNIILDLAYHLSLAKSLVHELTHFCQSIGLTRKEYEDKYFPDVPYLEQLGEVEARTLQEDQFLINWALLEINSLLK